MFGGILKWLGLGAQAKKETVATVRLDVIAEQVKEFNEAKKEINAKITTLESRTSRLDDTVAQTLQMTRDNQSRLRNIEDGMEKILHMSETFLATKGAAPAQPSDYVQRRQPRQEGSV